MRFWYNEVSKLAKMDLHPDSHRPLQTWPFYTTMVPVPDGRLPDTDLIRAYLPTQTDLEELEDDLLRPLYDTPFF